MSRLALFIHDVIPRLDWRWFGAGALQAYLSEGGRTEQRVHIWHPKLIKPGIVGQGNLHNHRFSFRSQVLCGYMRNRTVDIVRDDGAEQPRHYDIYEVTNARQAKATSGSHDSEPQKIGRCLVYPRKSEAFGAGCEYEFPRGAYHESSYSGVTVTLITKFDQKDDAPARILCPAGRLLVHAFGGKQPYPTECVIREAQEALMAVIA